MSGQFDDNARLATLRETGLLDSPTELRFDRFTRLAAALFKAPIALVSLIDENRQWFKSCVGLDTRETPREQAFCDHAIRAPGVMVIEDARADPRFANNPLVTGPPHIRFYAGAPLVLKSGHALGTLCVIDDQPRGPLADAEITALSDLAAMVVSEIEASDAARAREVAVAELKHRMGNVFGQIAGMISLGDSAGQSKQSYILELRNRMTSLHEVNRRLANNDWASAELRTVIADTLRPLGSAAENVMAPSEPLTVSARAAMAISMVVSELASNSLKHGALRGGGGGARLDWRCKGQRFTLQWSESAVAGAKPTELGSGFGSILLRRLAPAELQGEASYDIDETGVRYTLVAPEQSLS